MTASYLKHILFCLCLFPGAHYTSAQNLVPDSSFEKNKIIPVDFSAINASYTWNMPSLGTTDLFCTCDKKRKKISLVDVPQNPMGYQEAHSGTCYAGLFAFSHGDYREYLQSPLKAPLEKNKTYRFSMYISLADYSRTCPDQLGVCFLTAKARYKTTEVITDLEPVYINIEKAPGKDVKSWHRVTVTYTAQGGEQYILIGGFEFHTIKKTKFKAPKEIRSRINQSTERDAYYYIDDISLVETIPVAPVNNTEKPKMETQLPAGITEDSLLAFKTIVFQSNSAVLLPASYRSWMCWQIILLKTPGCSWS